MKRVAIPVHNDQLSEYFGKCHHYKIYDIDKHSIIEKKLEIPQINNIEELPAWASENGITDIITYKIDKQIIMLFNKYKINLFIGISRNSPEKLIEEFMAERLCSDKKIISEIIDNS
jgi:predicted Fe-Mo cluster-binding NifX family protein